MFLVKYADGEYVDMNDICRISIDQSSKEITFLTRGVERWLTVDDKSKGLFLSRLKEFNKSSIDLFFYEGLV